MRITKPLRDPITANGFRFFAVQRALRALHGSTDGLDCGAYGRFIQLCSDGRLIRQGLQLHARLVLFSVVPDNFLASKLIAFYSKCRRLELARKVFDEIPHRNTFAWNAMIIAYSVHGAHQNVLRLFSSMVLDDSSDVRADNFTVTCVMKAVAELFSDSGLAKEVHCYVLRNGFLDSDVFVGNSLVTCYARCDEIGFARALFDRIPRRDIVSWNSMLSAYSQAGFYEECKSLYKEMLGSAKVRPNSGTLVSVLQACGQSKDLYFGMDVHRYLSENQIVADIILYNVLVGFYAKCGSLDYALELFEWMEEKDEVTYASMISGYMAHGLVENAIKFFNRIQNPRIITWNAVIIGLVQNSQNKKALDLLRTMVVYGNRPNFVTLSSILPTISHFSFLKGGKEIHAYAFRNGYEKNVYVSTAVIDAYAKSGFLHGAQLVFDQSKCKSLIIWTAIISAYAAHGVAHMSLRLFSEMVRNGIQPDEVTFVAVLTSCSHFGVVDEASKLFNSMLQKYGIKPSIEHYTCMVTVLSRAGRLSEAADFISKMPVEPSAKVWGALLNGASVAGNVEMGKFACDHLFKIEPENTGNYVIMANLYTQSKRYKEASMIRERLNRIGVKKVAGSSWIETSDRSQVICSQ